MNIFFDTSVLVAAAVRHHPHHPQAVAAMRQAMHADHSGFVAAHSLAETYAVLTRLPVQPPIHPTEAYRIIQENVLAHFTPLGLQPNDYRQVLGEITEAGLRGGLVYDALLLQCARKKNCDRIYTFDVGHFRRLAPDMEEKICAPA